MFNKITLIFLSSIPAIILCLFVNTNLSIISTEFDSLRYIKPAISIYTFGGYETLETLPTYPYILSFFFKIFGLHNYLSIIIFQSFLLGLISFFLATVVKNFNKNFFYPTLILTCLWPNLIWRTTYISPEIVLTFLLVLSFYFLIRFFYEKHNFLIYLSFIFIGLSCLTRPNVIVLPLLLLIFLPLIFKKKLNYSNSKIFKTVSFCFLIFFAIISTQVLKVYKISGHFGYSSQSGRAILSYYYPCLATSFGCGKRNIDAFNSGKKEYEERIKKLKPEDLKNQIILSRIQRSIGIEKIRQLELRQIIQSSVGSQIKLFFHNFFYDVLFRFDITAFYFSETENTSNFLEKIIKFFKIVFTDKYMIIWFFFEMVLLLSRLFQFQSFVHFIKTRENKILFSLLFIFILSQIITLIGFSTVRYRTPLEPFLILMTIFGFSQIKQKLFMGKKYK